LRTLIGDDPVLDGETEAALVHAAAIRVERPLQKGHALHTVDGRLAGGLEILRARHTIY